MNITDKQILERYIRTVGYSEVVYEVTRILLTLEQENFLGMFPYWREQREGLNLLVFKDTHPS